MITFVAKVLLDFSSKALFDAAIPFWIRSVSLVLKMDFQLQLVLGESLQILILLMLNNLLDWLKIFHDYLLFDFGCSMSFRVLRFSALSFSVIFSFRVLFLLNRSMVWSTSCYVFLLNQNDKFYNILWCQVLVQLFWYNLSYLQLLSHDLYLHCL